MDPFTISALVAGGTGLLGSFLQSSENSRQFARQKELLAMQQEYNTSMWNANNSYNHPASQLDRLMSTGINPNDAMKALSGNTAQQVATPAVPSISSTGSSSSALINSIGTIADYFLKQKQSQNIDAQTERTQIENKLLEKDLGVRDELNELTLDQYRANISKSLADTDLSRKRIDELSYQLSDILPELKQKTIVEREKIAQDMMLSVQELANAVRQGNLLSEQIETERASRSQIYTQIEGQKFRNQVDKLHARFANEFGIDISSDKWQLLVEAALTGDENSDRIVKALTSTLTGTAESAVGNVVKPVAGYVNKGVNRMRSIIGNAYKGQGDIPLYSPEQRLFYNLFGSIINPH